MKKTKVIALDIGEVCIKLCPERCFAALGLSSSEQVPVEFLAATDMLEKGHIPELDWMTIFQEVTGGNFSNDELRAAWNLLIGEEIDGIAEIVRGLVERGYRLVFFSDTSQSHILEVYRKLSFSHIVTGAIFSYEVGAKKPDNRMYEAFEEKYGKPVFYIDDRQQNIEAGLKRGWPSHCFSGVASLRTFITGNI
ncbi:MAG: HAD family hydrolase [Victivallaceae bacterium]